MQKTTGCLALQSNDIKFAKNLIWRNMAASDSASPLNNLYCLSSLQIYNIKFVKLLKTKYCTLLLNVHTKLIHQN